MKLKRKNTVLSSLCPDAGAGVRQKVRSPGNGEVTTG
jgi:hypothetical protein